MLQPLGITSTTNSSVAVNWVGTATLQSATKVLGPFVNATNVVNTVNNTYLPPAGTGANFFRLAYPPYPSYLSTNPIYQTTP